MKVNPSDMERLLWIAAEPILGVKACAGTGIGKLAEKMRAMPENNPLAPNDDPSFISGDPWSVRKARAGCWLTVFEAHQNAKNLDR